MFSSATLRGGLLIVYGSAANDIIVVQDTPVSRTISVSINRRLFTFPRTGVTRLRILGLGGDDTITLGHTRTPNLHGVLIDGGDGNDMIHDNSPPLPFNPTEWVSILGGAGDDQLYGGPHTVGIDGGPGDDGIYGGNSATSQTLSGGDGNDHVLDQSLGRPSDPVGHVVIFGEAGDDMLTGGADTVSIDGGDGNDTIYGGQAGATLYGGAGDDVVSVNSLKLGNGLFANGTRGTTYDAFGPVLLDGGPGDDYLVGNNLKIPSLSDTLTGGEGNDELLPFGTDVVTDAGNGIDPILGGNQFTPPAAVTQSATFSVVVYGVVGDLPQFPPQGVGVNGPNSRVYFSDDHGTLTMRGSADSQFLLGDLLIATGFDASWLALPDGALLVVNGSPSTLTGTQIAGYQIRDCDVIQLRVNYYKWIFPV